MSGVFASSSAGPPTFETQSHNRIKPILALPSALVLAGDVAILLAVPSLAYRGSAIEMPGRFLLFFAINALAVCISIASRGGYGHAALLTPRGLRNALVASVAVTCLTLTGVLLLGHPHAIGLRPTGATIAGIVAFMAASRLKARRHLRRQADALSRASATVIVCYDRSPREIGKTLAAHGISRNIAGVCYVGERQDGDERACGPVIPDIESLMKLIGMCPVRDIVFIYQRELEAMAPAYRRHLLAGLVSSPARVWLACDLGAELPSLLEARTGRYRMVPIVNDTLVCASNLTKRVFDVAVAGAILCAAAPLIALIALAIRLSGSGPVVFRQTRTGAYGRRFTVLKFRSMRHAPGLGFAQACRRDPRVTRIGRILRRSSLDEILQIVNVLRGEMSLVGPRPHAPETCVSGVSFEDAVSLYRMRHRVKPGITGLAQVRGLRGETARLDHLERRVTSDLEYIDRWSVWLDVTILFRTLPALFGQRNAY